MPGRLGTTCLWLGAFSLLGPAKLAGLLVAGSLIAPGLLCLDRSRRQPFQPTPQAAQELPTPPAPLPRAALAGRMGLSESQLFRARHASICTVHHNAEGRIVALEVPASALPAFFPSPDAHPVG